MTIPHPGSALAGDEVAEVRRTPRDYLKYILQSSERHHLLVEGKSDRDLFQRLFERIDPNYRRRILIDTADRIAWDPELTPGTNYGARDKVVRVCTLAGALPDADRLVGVVDREYDDFRFDPEVCDDRPEVRVDGRLVRTRGHSVENYLFDFVTFGDRMREYVPSEVTRTIDLFRRVFPDAVRIACAIGLTCRHHPRGNHS
jgi:hypothetical protein